MGPKQSLEGVLFHLKSPCLRGFHGTFLASNATQVAVISGWNVSYGSMRLRGLVRHLAFGDMGHAKCAIGPKQSLEGVLFGLKSPSSLSG